MKFALTFSGSHPRDYPRLSRLAEEAGFESVFVSDHVVFPSELPDTYPYAANRRPPVSASQPLFDPFVVLGSIASATSIIRLGISVYILPLRHPLHAARPLVTLDALSGGRVTLGVGVGWLSEEFDVLGQSFQGRGARTDEMIGVMRRLFTEDIVAHNGAAYSWQAVRFEPKPEQDQGIPIEIGGTSAAALRRAGRIGDGWIGTGSESISELQNRIDTVLAHRAAASRSGRFEITSRVPASFDPSQVERLAEVGVTRIASQPPTKPGRRPTTKDYEQFIDRYADQVIAKSNNQT